MIARIARAFGKQLPLNALFELPTIEQLAKSTYSTSQGSLALINHCTDLVRISRNHSTTSKLWRWQPIENPSTHPRGNHRAAGRC